MSLVCKSGGIWDDIVNPIFGCRVEITPNINPKYVGLERSCPRDYKNVSYVGVGLVLTSFDLIEYILWKKNWLNSLLQEVCLQNWWYLLIMAKSMP